MYTCRYCQNKLSTMFVDLGFAPLSNDYIEKQNENKGQLALPLKAAFCEYCKLVQTLDFEMPDQIFNSNISILVHILRAGFNTAKIM